MRRGFSHQRGFGVCGGVCRGFGYLFSELLDYQKSEFCTTSRFAGKIIYQIFYRCFEIRQGKVKENK